MGKNYEQDMITAMKKQNDLIVQQVFIELIQVVAECETYDEFRKRMYGIALGYVKDLESQGIKVPEKPGEKKSDDKDMLII
jgi:predicted RNase H-like HicB family nuclease